jgi:RNA polymerase sigma-70 factor (ECF subfamily)
MLPAFVGDGHRVIRHEAWADSADELASRRETRELVRRCMDRLPCVHRTVLILRDIEGLDTDETARCLDVLPGAVKTRLHRARMALREMIEAELAVR